MAVLRFITSRPGRWIVVLAWLLIAGVSGPLAGKLEEAQDNEAATFLPAGTDSLEANELQKRFPSGEAFPATVVVRRDGGLQPADLRAVGDLGADLVRDRPPGGVGEPVRVVSPDRTTALLAVNLRPEGDSDLLKDGVEDVRDRAHALESDGLRVEVTGPAGFARDAVAVFSQINGTLLYATAALVFLLLILIYRSPIFWFVPLVTVAFAEVASRAAAYGLVEAGFTVNGQSAGILPVLVFGAGTDYALLLVARYREELRFHADTTHAMRLALRRAGPAVVASGLTVMLALLCLVVAQVNSTSALGPVGALGIAIAMLSMVTLLPALLLVFGRRIFWPFIPRAGTGDDPDADAGRSGAWRRVGERVAAAPGRVLAGSVAVLVLLCAGLFSFQSGLAPDESYRNSVEAVQGQDLLAQAFPTGATAPTQVIVRDPQRAGAVVDALRGTDGVARVDDVERGEPGARLQVVLADPPYSNAAQDRIEDLRDAADAAGGEVLVGGPTAEQHDLEVASARDNVLIVPIVLAVVFLVLMGLLRAVVLPLLLIGTVVLSFGAALGLSSFLFTEIYGHAGQETTLPLYAFIFLVALGVDYNIFLMARAREEALRLGTREGMLRGLAVTGAVITSAGIVLAGTFSTLAVLPLISLTQIGVTIALGVLLDTFVVRSVVVPALVLKLGDRVWWPSRRFAP